MKNRNGTRMSVADFQPSWRKRLRSCSRSPATSGCWHGCPGQLGGRYHSLPDD